MSEIVLDGITKRYQDGTTAVRSLDLSIADGELMVQPARVHVDLSSLHFFDPDTGDSLRG